MTDRDYLSTFFAGLPDGVIDAVLGLVMTVLVLVPGLPDPGAAGSGAPEASVLGHIGGLPEMAADIAWPRPGLTLMADTIAGRVRDEMRDEMAAHIRADVPLVFVAQIDLAALAQTDAPVADLPRSGRLLFFYDPIVAPYYGGRDVGRVIWDQSAAEAAIARDMPAELVAAEARHMRQTLIEIDRDSPRNQAMADVLRQAGLSEGEIAEVFARSGAGVVSPFRAPHRPLSGVISTVLPAIGTVEFAARASDDLRARAAASYDPDAPVDFADAYTEALWGWPEHEEPVLQLQGPPLPVQDDPRYSAAIITTYGVPFLDPDAFERAFEGLTAALSDWQLLLQVPLAAWQPETSDAVLYYLIRAEDLRARRFDQALAVYQQS